MKRIVQKVVLGAVTAALLCAASLSAQAQGRFDWGGLYVGVHAGYGFAEADVIFPGTAIAISNEPEGFIGGAQLGLQHQFGNIVLGLETSISFGYDTDNDTACTGIATRCNQSLNWLVVAGPKLGLAFNRSLLYLHGGFAAAQFDDEAKPFIANYDDTRTHFGWAIGGGFEYAFSNTVIAGIDYVHADVGSQTYAQVPFAANQTRNIDGTIDVVRARLSFKLSRQRSLEPLK